MPLQHAYSDAYLAPLVTEARETQAAADVADLGALPAAWVTRLSILRVYVITCTESMARADDTFSAKLSAYRKDYADQLAQARAAQAAAASGGAGDSVGGSSCFTVGLERA